MKTLLLLLALIPVQEDLKEAYEYRRRAFAAGDRGDHTEAVKWKEKALALFESGGYAKDAAWSHSNLAWSHIQLGRGDDAAGHIVKALQAAGKIGAADVENKVLANLSALIKRSGKVEREKVEEWFDSILDALDAKALHARTQVRINQRDFYKARNDFKAALRVLDQMIKLNRDAKYRYGEALMIHSRGYLKGLNEDRKGELEDSRAALKIREEIGDHDGAGWSLNNQGYVLLKIGKSEEAEALLRRAVESFEKVSNYQGMAQALANLVELYEAQEEDEKLRKAQDRVWQLSRKKRAGVGSVNLKVRRKRAVETLKDGEVVWRVAWDGKRISLSEPGEKPAFSNPVGENGYVLELNGISIRFRDGILSTKTRSRFVEKGQTAEVTRAGAIRIVK